MAQLLTGTNDPLALSPLLEGTGQQILAAVKAMGLEGVVGKRCYSLDEPGRRSGRWIKYRANREQEFVIGGYIPGSHGFKSLIVGTYQGRKLMYAARVKNGFVPRIRDQILPLLKKSVTDKCPFANLPEGKGQHWGQPLTAEKVEKCRWVRPTLVCQVALVEGTVGNRLRHSSFVAMRDDKPAKKVVRET